MELGCLLRYGGDSYFSASLAEPVSCVIGGYHAMYHTNKRNYDHAMGVKEGGSTLILGGAGPMGLGAVEYPLRAGNRPARVVVCDVDEGRLARAARLIPPESAAKQGVELIYANTAGKDDPAAFLRDLTGGAGYDDVFVYAPVKALAELGDRLLAFDGCLNFFAGPQNADFSALINLYNCHYTSTHILGSTGGNTDDLKEALRLAGEGKMRPAVMVTHICGLDAVPQAVAGLPSLRAGKILAYTHANLPLTALADFAERGKTDPLFAELSASCQAHDGLWNAEAERVLLAHCGAS
jgi:threonine dehydrogenase-like Zn-dependent dehydrogenase